MMCAPQAALKFVLVFTDSLAVIPAQSRQKKLKRYNLFIRKDYAARCIASPSTDSGAGFYKFTNLILQAGERLYPKANDALRSASAYMLV